MEKLVKGDIVVVPFPFSDLSSSKRRPALVIATLDGDDVILCQITSQQTKDRYALPITFADYKQGSLAVASNIRPNRIFTADRAIILQKAATLTDQAYNEVMKRLITILTK